MVVHRRGRSRTSRSSPCVVICHSGSWDAGRQHHWRRPSRTAVGAHRRYRRRRALVESQPRDHGSSCSSPSASAQPTTAVMRQAVSLSKRRTAVGRTSPPSRRSSGRCVKCPTWRIRRSSCRRRRRRGRVWWTAGSAGRSLARPRP